LPSLTLEDIAKKAGVSRSTVSRVANEHPHISDSVRERVLEVIQETGYQPNAAARTLASQRSQMIGLVLPFSFSSLFTDPYYPLLIQGICQTCNQYDYTLAFFLASDKDDEKKIYTRVPNNGLLDGVLIQSGLHGDQQIIGHLIDAGIPLVVIGRPFPSNKVSFVNIDNVEASKNAVAYLAALGHQRIATITGPLESTVGIDRRNGYLKALKERGMKINRKLIAEGDFSDRGGFEAMQKILLEYPDAVFAASDMMAIGAIRAIHEKGLRVPEDISVVGFDDIPSTAESDVALTTVRQPIIQIGAKAVELLFDQIENETKSPQSSILDTELIIRSSCSSLKLDD